MAHPVFGDRRDRLIAARLNQVLQAGREVVAQWGAVVLIRVAYVDGSVQRDAVPGQTVVGAVRECARLTFHVDVVMLCECVIGDVRSRAPEDVKTADRFQDAI